MRLQWLGHDARDHRFGGAHQPGDERECGQATIDIALRVTGGRNQFEVGGFVHRKIDFAEDALASKRIRSPDPNQIGKLEQFIARACTTIGLLMCDRLEADFHLRRRRGLGRLGHRGQGTDNGHLGVRSHLLQPFLQVPADVVDVHGRCMVSEVTSSVNYPGVRC